MATSMTSPRDPPNRSETPNIRIEIHVYVAEQDPVGSAGYDLGFAHWRLLVIASVREVECAGL